MRSQAKAPSTGSTANSETAFRLGAVRTSRLLALAFVVVCMLVPAAEGSTVYRPTGETFATEGGIGQVAVDDATGSVLLPRASYGTGVDVFAPYGGSVTYQSSFAGDPSLGSVPVRSAVDQSARSVYVSDAAFQQIFKYDIGGSGPLTFTLDPTFTSPLIGSGPGEVGSFSSPLAVDPSTGDLLVADTGNQRVSRFAPDGTFVSSFDGSDSLAGRFHQLSSVAVDGSGAIYVVDITQPDILYEHGRSVLERFAADGTADNTFAPALPTPRTVTVDQSSGNLIVAGRSDGGYPHDADNSGPYPVRLYVLHGDRLIDEQDLPTADSGSTVRGMAVGGGASRRLYVATVHDSFGAPGVKVFDALLAADVLLDEVTAVTTSTAHVSGTVDRLGKATSYHFEYSREGGPVRTTEEADIGAGAGPEPVSADLSGLTPNSDYVVRLVATTAESGGTAFSRPRHLRTLASAPGVVTGDALDLTQTAATLLGKVNPFGQQTTYRFEYGPTMAYGLQIPVDHDDVIGNGRDALPVHAYLSGLQSGTEYHYRLVARNATGVTAGSDRTFTTRAAAAPLRVYEQVSPVEKSGSEVSAVYGFSASPDGNSLMYQWKAAPGDASTGPVNPRSSAWRSSTGWTSQPLDAPQLPGPAAIVNNLLTLVQGISEDGSKTITNSLAKLAPGAVEGNSNFYLRDTRTGEYTTMLTNTDPVFSGISSGLGVHPIIDGTPGYNHVLIRPYVPLSPGDPSGALYEWTDGQVRLASIAPDGSPMGDVYAGDNIGETFRDPHYISADGSKVFFQTIGSGTYVRIDGEETIRIGGHFGGASRDGRYAFVYGHELIGGDGNSGYGLYRFDTEARQLEFLTPTRDNDEGHLQVSANGASVFFESTRALLPGAVADVLNIYVWHGGQLGLVASSPRDGNTREFMSSPNGRYFTFGSYSQLTDYDNSSETACVNFTFDPVGPVPGKGVACSEIYRYDVETEKLTCASCPRDGSAPTGGAHNGGNEHVEGDFSYPRAVLDDGTVIFDTPEQLNSRDSNSNRDVYTFDGTETTLISSGFTNSRSEFDAATPDGRSIFFTTQDQLVGQDTDSLADVYVARIDGGIASQNPPPPRPECIRDDCKATPNQGPELPFGGSEGLSGPENVKAPARKRCGKGRHARKVKGKQRCVKQHKKQAKSNRRQGR